MASAVSAVPVTTVDLAGPVTRVLEGPMSATEQTLDQLAFKARLARKVPLAPTEHPGSSLAFDG